MDVTWSDRTHMPTPTEVSSLKMLQAGRCTNQSRESRSEAGAHQRQSAKQGSLLHLPGGGDDRASEHVEYNCDLNIQYVVHNRELTID
jgi:hypothetical protein